MREAPEQEFTQRVRNVREQMGKHGLDALVIFADMRYVGGGNAFYLSSFRPTIDGFTEVIVPAEGELALVVQPGMGDFVVARRDSWIADVRGKVHGHGVNWPAETRQVLEERGLAGGKVGISGIDLMSPGLYRGFQETLSRATLVDATGLMEAVCFVKSPFEMDVIREACRLTDVSIDGFMEAAKPGRRHTEAIAEGEYRCKREGADDFLPLMGGGTPCVWGMFRGESRFGEGDVVAAEFNARIGGYWGQVCRTRFLGTPSREHARCLDLVRESYARMVEALKPGVTAHELWEAGMKVFEAAGFEYGGHRWGHGMGLMIHTKGGTGAVDCHIIPGDPTVVTPGCYLILHPNILPGPDADAMFIEGDAFLMTETGKEQVTHARRW